MKHFKCITKSALAVLIIGLLFSSCSDNNEDLQIDDSANDAIELSRASEVDAASSSMTDIVTEVFEFDEANPNGRVQPLALPDCVTITVVAQQAFREVTIDFGNEGCLVRGHVLKGQIVFSYTRDIEAQEVLITYNLIDFYFDNKNVLGSRTILREKENDNGNPQFTHNLDLTVIWPNGVQASRTGTKVREWVEGFGSGNFSDNVFEVSGDWTTTFVNGNSHTYEVMTPLRREVICTYFVSGTVEVQRTNFGGTFDYGNGDCDNQASFTFNNGTEINITLN
ncbi:hypothetical protein BTO05_11400 [Winogradskyella sp. PC-19]|uniref:hypothetical protein n=1 Tax=unclassified Winogradskyella TaxID=2615021 RepID=UPI000B3D398D|nr:MULTISPECIES: hypothetical protein [unclassified Winogradskyella]ARV10213.1 hypothetical protein BTO05_11400 [Winogradskyella sp. PC-19]RZN82847.1 MAG: hypothetical protein EVB12_02390 [Winogradskyella sp.]